MLGIGQETICCHVCSADIKLKKGAPPPAVCPVCGTDLANPAAETVRGCIQCEHIKGFLGIAPGELYLTTRRVFWLKRVNPTDGGYSGTDAVLKMAANAKGKGEGELKVNVPLEDVDHVVDCKKGLRRGVTLHTKSGQSYNFFFPNLGNTQPLKDMLAPWVR